ncbi:MAG: DNA polymerase III subunit epsilon [Pseudomonadota bacterium]
MNNIVREICLDTETTGLSPNNGDRIIEIGCVELIDRVLTGNNFHVYINPERDVPEAAFRVHGISTEFLQDKPKFAEICQDFVDYIQGGTLVIHNASFDVKFINAEFERLSIKPINLLSTIDTVDMARRLYPGAKANLDALCSRFNINLSRRKLHGALLDAELLADVYINMTGGQQTKMQLDKVTVNNDKAGNMQARKYKSKYPKRQFPLSEEERKIHQEFIAEHIKDSTWYEKIDG